MKSHFRSGIGGLVVLICALAFVRSTIAAQLKEATVTQIVKQVDLLPTGTAARAATLNDNVRDGTAVRTGTDSRTELTFTDQTLARLGANTIFSFNEGTRNLDLGGGAMLLAVPKGAGGAKISTAAVTAAITGTTVIIEYHPGKRAEPETTSNQKPRGFAFGLITRKPKPPTSHGGYIKFITLEGVARVYLNNRVGESVLVPAGHLLILSEDATHMPDPVDVDLERLLKTSLLITDFPPLVSQQLIVNEARKQKALKAQGKLIDTNLVIYGRGTLVSLADPPPFDTIDQSIAALGLPGTIGAKEVGPLTTITSPNTYVMSAGSTIKTAPTITTSGVTNQGKIYRSVALDGLPSDYFFGSTTAFDNSSGFNASVMTPVASFRFSNLLVIGDPTIIVPKGGATNLALITEGTIATEATAGTLTFAGMNSVLFATTNGSISFSGPKVFSDVRDLIFYARGSTSILFVQSNIFNVGALNLFSEGPLTIFNSSETLTTSTGDGGNLTAVSNGDMLLEGSTIMATSGVVGTGPPAGAGGNVSLTSVNGGITLSGSTIQVSSADPPGTPNRRSSASGGTIAIESDRPDSVAIQISSSSQLLSLLEAAAPGPGGLITLKATGTMSTIFAGGNMQATHGGIDIRHTGDLGSISLDQINVRGDIIKIATLGTNGVLTIGKGILSADSVLKLYAPSSNGMIRFVSSCTIGAKVTNIIAAGSVTILNGVMVQVTGRPVDVYVNFIAGVPQANYSGFGGNGSTTGTFTGLGATNPQQLSAAPALGAPGGP